MIEKVDLRKLKTNSTLLPSNSLGLSRNVWFHTSLYWCRRGREGQQRLNKTSFAFKGDASGHRFATMVHDEFTKNHPGVIRDIENFEKLGRMYETHSARDGYSALQKCLAKLKQELPL